MNGLYEHILAEESPLKFSSLLKFFLKGLRNGNWRSLGRLEKGLYICALRLAKLRGRILNVKLLMKLKAIICKLLTTPKVHILQSGEAKAKAMLKKFNEIGVLNWAPEVKNWLKDGSFIFYLGAMELFGR
jgi:hypothetical protein